MTMTSASPAVPYPARLEIDHKPRLDRLTSGVRIVWAIPILIILGLLTSSGDGGVTVTDEGRRMRDAGGSISLSFGIATALMILFRQRYPRWWFDFQLALTRFSFRVFAYLALLRDEYPSTEDEQAVHLDLDYPDARQLNRWLPLVKWLLAIPHYIVLLVLTVLCVFAVIIAWFAILITGGYPRGLFDFVVGVFRWWLRVAAYAFLLITDRYPPFNAA